MMVIINNITKKHDNFCLTQNMHTQSEKCPPPQASGDKYQVHEYISITGIMFDDMRVKLMDISRISGILQ